MSNWKPSEGLYKAETLVKILEIEAEAAGSMISPVFRHRMVEMIAQALDGKSSLADSAWKWTNRQDVERIANGHHPEEHTDDEAIHAADSGHLEAQPKPKKAKPAKAGAKKRGRPSKAEIAARKAAQA